MAVTLEQFVANLIHSGLMSADEVSSFQESFPPDQRPTDVRGLARELVHAGKLTKYQATAIYQGKTKGLVLGDYVVLDKIGAGGMGQVLKAQHRRMKRIVAVKLLPPAAMKSPEAVRRFYREVEAAAKLAHPNIVTAHDAGDHEGLHYLVMEYVEGRDLARIVSDDGPLPIELAVDCVLQAARGLEYAHRQGVIHRDVKPGNLLLDHEGTVKILDMGLARMQAPEGTMDETGSERLTGTGQVMGTCDYMAPEQAEDTHAADHRADVYALGCTLYRLLTGEPPYAGETLVQVLLAHRQAPIPSIRDARPDVPPELDAVFHRMMAKTPQYRYQSMAEVIPDLEACLPGERPASQPPPPPPVSQPRQSTTDSKLNAFLEGLGEGGVATGRKAPPIAQETIAHRPAQETGVISGQGLFSRPLSRNKFMLLGIGGGVAALLLVAAVFLAVVARGGGEPEPEPQIARAAGASTAPAPQVELTSRQDETRLILRWPAPEREDAVLEIDGQSQDLSSLLDETNPDQLRIPLQAGSHRVWIARRGIQPFDQTFAIDEGETTTIAPVWQMPEGEEEPRREDIAATGPSDDEAMAKEAATPEPKPPVEPAPAPPERPEIRAAEKERQAAEARYAEAIAPAEEMVAAGRFGRALAALGQIQFGEEDLAARLDRRRDQVQRLVALKTRIINAINAADPPLKKSALRIRGANGEIVKADEEGITAKLITGKMETVAWRDIGPQAVQKLVGLVGGDQNADGWIAAGLLALVYDDAALGAALFGKARDLGAEIEPYLGPLASSAFAKVQQLIEQKEFHEAETGLAEIEAKYGDTPWFASNKDALEPARAAIRVGIPESEAEQLYAQAAKLFGEQQLFDVKPLVEKLKADYGATNVVSDADRKPSFVAMQSAVADLGIRLTVRLDGQGDFKTIQEAIDAAPPNSLIEIQDNGPYYEKTVIPRDKHGLTLRGSKGCWPTISSGGPVGTVADLMVAQASPISLERLVISHTDFGGEGQNSLVTWGSCHLRSVILAGGTRFSIAPNNEIENCCFAARSNNGHVKTPTVIRDSICLRDAICIDGKAKAVLENVIAPTFHLCQAPFELRCSTVPGLAVFQAEGSLALDSILGSVQSSAAASRIDFCNVVSGKFVDRAEPGKGCFSAPPQFANAKNLDYRLLPTSPCIGRASDGGDVGCRFTPEMIEMLTLALQLRQQGIIKF
ncbi:MAG TPA: protein kinase [Thermoguttaceae bacterium]|nr:protein kinase [Thermoguttaceae bacterium]